MGVDIIRLEPTAILNEMKEFDEMFCRYCCWYHVLRTNCTTYNVLYPHSPICITIHAGCFSAFFTSSSPGFFNLYVKLLLRLRKLKLEMQYICLRNNSTLDHINMNHPRGNLSETSLRVSLRVSLKEQIRHSISKGR